MEVHCFLLTTIKTEEFNQKQQLFCKRYMICHVWYKRQRWFAESLAANISRWLGWRTHIKFSHYLLWLSTQCAISAACKQQRDVRKLHCNKLVARTLAAAAVKLQKSGFGLKSLARRHWEAEKPSRKAIHIRRKRPSLSRYNCLLSCDVPYFCYMMAPEQRRGHLETSVKR